MALLLFGAKRLPEFGRSLGSALREFKHSVDVTPNGQTDTLAAPTHLNYAHDITVTEHDDAGGAPSQLAG